MTMTDPGRTSSDTERAILEEALDRLFQTRAPFALVRATEGEWPAELWSSLAEMGVPWLGLAPDRGGVGGDTADAVVAVTVAARHAAPVPLAESSLIGGWVLVAAGLDLPGQGIVTAVAGWPPHQLRATVAGDALVVSGAADGVPWGRFAETVVALCETPEGVAVVGLPGSSLGVEPAQNLAGEPRDRIVADQVTVPAGAWRPSALAADALLYRAAAARSIAIAAAAGRVLDLSVAHAGERVQFDRPIASFQVIQHHLARMAGAVAAAQGAAHLARRALGGDPMATREDAASAKVVASQAASLVSSLAHQVHGAIGMTREHDLHLFTRRLWAWRDEFGTEHFWAARLGRAVAGVPGEPWYALVSKRTDREGEHGSR